MKTGCPKCWLQMKRKAELPLSNDTCVSRSNDGTQLLTFGARALFLAAPSCSPFSDPFLRIHVRAGSDAAHS